MTIEFKARPEHNLGILAHSGTIKDNEFIAFYTTLLKSDSFDPLMNLLVDLREADSSFRSNEALRRIAEFSKITLSDTTTLPKVAVVAPKDISFGLARMYENFLNSVPWNFVVFRSMEAALAWLGVHYDLMCDNNKHENF